MLKKSVHVAFLSREERWIKLHDFKGLEGTPDLRNLEQEKDKGVFVLF
jgi:hypothetical protein